MVGYPKLGIHNSISGFEFFWGVLDLIRFTVIRHFDPALLAHQNVCQLPTHMYLPVPVPVLPALRHFPPAALAMLSTVPTALGTRSRAVDGSARPALRRRCDPRALRAANDCATHPRRVATVAADRWCPSARVEGSEMV